MGGGSQKIIFDNNGKEGRGGGFQDTLNKDYVIFECYRKTNVFFKCNFLFSINANLTPVFLYPGKSLLTSEALPGSLKH